MSEKYRGYLKQRVHTFFKPPAVEGNYPARGELYYVKGSNGSGKSTVPTQLALRDPEAYVVTHGGKILLTVCPSYNIICIGKYDKSKSKGVDTLTDTEQIMFAVELSELPEFIGYDVIFEGIIPATILETWMVRLNRPARRLVALFLDTPKHICVERVTSRNGGADFDQSLVEYKWVRVNSHRERHRDLFPNVSAGMLRSNGLTIDQAVEAFLNRDFGSI